MDKNCDKPDEIEPKLPDSEAIKEIMEKYRKQDQCEAPSTAWFFCGAFVLIMLVLLSIMLSSCQIMTEGCKMDIGHYLEKDHLENSTDSKSLLTVPKAI